MSDWDFENMSLEELAELAKETIDKYNAILLTIGGTMMLNTLDSLREEGQPLEDDLHE